MKNVILALCVAICGNALAATSSAQPMDTVQTFLDSFNKGDIEAAEATQSNDVVIVDEFAPFQWDGQSAFKAWLDGLTRHDQAAGVTDGHMALNGEVREEVSGDRAYIVVATTYTFKQNGMAMRAPARMTFALHRGDGGWLISAWTYSAPRATPAETQ